MLPLEDGIQSLKHVGRKRVYFLYILCICKLLALVIRANYIAWNEQYQNQSVTVTSYS